MCVYMYEVFSGNFVEVIVEVINNIYHLNNRPVLCYATTAQRCSVFTAQYTKGCQHHSHAYAMPTQAKKGQFLVCIVSTKRGSERGYFVLVPMNIHKPNGVFPTRHNKSLLCLNAAGRNVAI